MSGLDNLVKKRYWFGDSFHMKLDEGDDTKNTFIGGLFSLILSAVVIMFAFQKGDVLVNKKDVDILSTINDNTFNSDDIFD